MIKTWSLFPIIFGSYYNNQYLYAFLLSFLHFFFGNYSTILTCLNNETLAIDNHHSKSCLPALIAINRSEDWKQGSLWLTRYSRISHAPKVSLMNTPRDSVVIRIDYNTCSGNYPGLLHTKSFKFSFLFLNFS